MFSKKQSYTLLDLFSGAGGFSLGFSKNGFRSVFANDHDKDCAETYNVNFGDHCVFDDINDICLQSAILT